MLFQSNQHHASKPGQKRLQQKAIPQKQVGRRYLKAKGLNPEGEAPKRDTTKTQVEIQQRAQKLPTACRCAFTMGRTAWSVR